jgi:hypothetical protein
LANGVIVATLYRNYKKVSLCLGIAGFIIAGATILLFNSPEATQGQIVLGHLLATNVLGPFWGVFFLASVASKIIERKGSKS